MPATIKRSAQNSNVFRAHGIMSRHRTGANYFRVISGARRNRGLAGGARGIRTCGVARNRSEGNPARVLENIEELAGWGARHIGFGEPNRERSGMK